MSLYLSFAMFIAIQNLGCLGWFSSYSPWSRYNQKSSSSKKKSFDLNNNLWSSCQDYYVHPDPQFIDNLQCRNITMPYNHNNDSSSTFNYHLFRFVPDSIINGEVNKPKGIIFGLAGGPLQDALSIMLAIGLEIMNELNHYIWIFPDHRGTGRSSRWPSCDTLNVSFDITCFKKLRDDIFGEDIYYQFTVNNSAHDVAKSIDIIQNETKSLRNIKTYIFGESYGSIWAQRIIRLYPDININGVILDSFWHPSGPVIDGERNEFSVSMSYASLCELDEICSSKFGVDGVKSTFYEFWKQVDEQSQSCLNATGFGSRFTSKTLKSSLISFWDPLVHDAKTFPIVFVYRATRCNDDDKIAIDNFFNAYKELESFKERFVTVNNEDGVGISITLGSFIITSELLFVEYEPNLLPFYTSQQIQEWNVNAILSRSSGESIYNLYFNLQNDLNPLTYQLNKNDNLLYKSINIDTNIPHLILQRTIDMATPYYSAANAVVQERSDSNWYLATLPLIGHSVTLYAQRNDKYKKCVWRIITDYMDESNIKPDMSCINKVLPIQFDWEGNTERVQNASLQYFGTEYVWDS